MILVVGGVASGKRSYARTLGYDEADMANATLDARPVVYNVQDMVWENPSGIQELLEQLALREVVISCEVGSGVVPLDARERLAREQTGRLLGQLAQRATRVVRCVCGIPQVLKG